RALRRTLRRLPRGAVWIGRRHRPRPGEPQVSPPDSEVVLMKKTLALMALGLSACTDALPSPPISLNAPTAIAVAKGRVCLNFSVQDKISTPIFEACEDDAPGAIGLVVNENSDRL